MRKVCVLYEDRRGPLKGFGLHELVKACVCDVLAGQPRQDITQALSDYRPLKGDTNLLKACRQDVDDIASDGRDVIAVFDNDQVRKLLKLPVKASDERVHQEIRKGASSDRLHIILLKQNMESVIEAAHACDPSIDKKRVDLAVKKKDPLERDAILARLTGPSFQSVRDCIRENLPSFSALIDLLRELLQRPPRSRKRG
jgi:hypothetical protein